MSDDAQTVWFCNVFIPVAGLLEVEASKPSRLHLSRHNPAGVVLYRLHVFMEAALTLSQINLDLMPSWWRPGGWGRLAARQRNLWRRPSTTDILCHAWQSRLDVVMRCCAPAGMAAGSSRLVLGASNLPPPTHTTTLSLFYYPHGFTETL